MKLVSTFLGLFIYATCAWPQQQEIEQLRIDTIKGIFLIEHDYRLNSNNDFIFRPYGIIQQPFSNRLKNGYKNGLFLIGDSLSLGQYKEKIIMCGYKIMESEKFQILLSQKINSVSDTINIEGYQFLNLHLTMVVGCLNKQEMLVMWKQNKLKYKKIPAYYILELL